MPSLDWAVLEVLAGTQSGLGASQIARLSARGTRAGQAAVLDRLVAHGIVEAEPANQGYLYRLNRDHLVAPAILQVATLRSELLRRIAAGIASLDPAPVHASVFGSFARGEAGETSEIDILVIASEELDIDDWDSTIEQLGSDVRRWTGNRCQFLTVSVARARELAQAHEAIVANWLEDELRLAGEPLSSIVAGNRRSRRGSRNVEAPR